jgi:hypothetical protein
VGGRRLRRARLPRAQRAMTVAVLQGNAVKALGAVGRQIGELQNAQACFMRAALCVCFSCACCASWTIPSRAPHCFCCMQLRWLIEHPDAVPGAMDAAASARAVEECSAVIVAELRKLS